MKDPSLDEGLNSSVGEANIKWLADLLFHGVIDLWVLLGSCHSKGKKWSFFNKVIDSAYF